MTTCFYLDLLITIAKVHVTRMQHDVAGQISRSAQQADDVVLPRDAVEHRRVLNILAQRRHRRRKKERLAAADRILAGAGPPNTRPVDAAVNDSRPDYNNDRSTLLPSNYDFDFENLSWETGTSTAAPIAALSADPLMTSNITDIIQDDAIQTSTFPDDHNLSMPDLDLLRAALENGKRLNQADQLFSLTAESTFQSRDGLGWTFALPENLKPTPAQLSLPNHPIIDVLPWPQVRTKLIMSSGRGIPLMAVL
ncbi:hypothetical protein M409DRAFT_61325 [Zasmidium cellare ATCC 36951]|uniref:BZIP domain-containing protein n=1 Tax=Zasmidium cellare ATCC 36951 TaxID=1080233 RepID=A0A6A6BXN6_ZASCE|nr:uncharacterized protein M409DRAFT_61325 [Zasmidium cellare ATCC 36951]KAF2158818.1 hypothetical protein M409DRAFT_61325 [Zasmidium cellare ATCC 36951]